MNSDLQYLIKITNVLRDRVKIVILFFFVAFIPIFSASLFVTAKYEAKATILVEEFPLKIPFYDEGLIYSSRQEKINLKEHMVILGSGLMASKVANSLSDETRMMLLPTGERGKIYNFFRTLSNIAFFYPGNDSTPSLPVEVLLSRKLRSSNIVYFNRREPNMIEIISLAESPDAALEIVIKYLDADVEVNLSRNRSEVIKALDFVQERWTKARNDLFSSENDLLDFKKKHDVVLSSATIEDLDLNAELRGLNYSVELAQANFKLITEKLMETEVKVAQIGNNIRIINPPEKPIVASGRLAMKIRILALLFGLISGIGTAILVEFLQDNVSSESELRRIVNIPVIGSIAHFENTRNS